MGQNQPGLRISIAADRSLFLPSSPLYRVLGYRAHTQSAPRVVPRGCGLAE